MLLETLVYDQRIFGLDPQLLFQMCFQMLAVFLLFLLGSYLLIDPVRKILENRKNRIMKDLQDARDSRIELTTISAKTQTDNATLDHFTL